MAKALELIPRDWLTDNHDGTYSITIREQAFIDTYVIRRDTGAAAQVGDVLSIQEDGTVQSRPAGNVGSFERCKLVGNLPIYRPFGHRTFVPFGVALDWPR